jgi:acyl-CoA hydrolase
LSASATTSPQNESRLFEVVLPEHADCRGALDGANALHIMGRAAFSCASRHARCAVMMAKADSLEFVRPIRIGSTVDIRARVVFQGQSSMTVVVEMAPDSAGAQEEPAYISGRFMMVAVDDSGIPMRIPHSPENLS